MREVIWTILAVAVVGLVTVGYEFGVISPGDAFFGAFAALAVFTGYQIVVREHMPFGEAISAIFTRPETYRDRAQYYAFLMVAGASALVVLQTVAYL